MKKALAICGSPRKGENTDSALDAVLSALGDEVKVEKVNLRKLKIEPCIACYKCARKKPCVLDDDMIDLYKKFDEADIVILASPMAFTTVNAQTKAMIDRLQAFYVSKYIKKEPLLDIAKPRAGCFICTSGTKDPDTAGVKLVADLFFKAVNAKHVADLYFDDTDSVHVKNRADRAERGEQAAQALLSFFAQDGQKE